MLHPSFSWVEGVVVVWGIIQYQSVLIEVPLRFSVCLVPREKKEKKIFNAKIRMFLGDTQSVTGHLPSFYLP